MIYTDAVTPEKTCFFDNGPNFSTARGDGFFFLSLPLGPPETHTSPGPPTDFSSISSSITHTSRTLQPYKIATVYVAYRSSPKPTYLPAYDKLVYVNIKLIIHTFYKRARCIVHVTIYIYIHISYTTCMYAREPIVIEHEGDLRRIRYTRRLYCSHIVHTGCGQRYIFQYTRLQLYIYIYII
jgi:hypothetical protein